jgi:hypothetical protein
MFKKLAQWLNLSRGGEKEPAVQEPAVAGKRGHYVDLDGTEIMKLHDELRWSFRRIARHLKRAPATVLQRYQEYHAAHPEPAPVAIMPDAARTAATPLEAPALAAKAVEPVESPVAMPDDLEDALSGLRLPGIATATPAVIPADPLPEPETQPEVDVSEIWGLDSVPEGSRQFFLVNGEQNVYYAHHLNQPAIGITEWRREYWQLPQFDNAVKLWVVINMDEDNSRFLRSLASDERMRATAVIAPPNRWYTVRSLAKDRMLTMRRVGSGYSDNVDFLYQFQPLPAPSRLGQWLRKIEPDAPQPGWIEPDEPSWKLRLLR